MAQVMINVSNITKSYRGYDIDHKESGVVFWAKNAFKLTSNLASTVLALDDVSFDVKKGEIFGIYGANGAGKTTLIKILSGLLLPDAGSLQVNGCFRADQIKEQISYVSTNGWMGLEWQLSVHENVILYGTIFGLPNRNLSTRCDAALARFGMLDERDKAISELSAGMRQKVTLARGFLLERPILFLDEPSVSLDVPSAHSFRNMLSEYTSDKENDVSKTIIITSHNPLDLALCDRILLLHEGHMAALGTIKELRQPLQGTAVLHIDFQQPDGQEKDSEFFRELAQLPGVIRASYEKTEGQKLTHHLRFLIQRDKDAVGGIIDWFIQNNFPITAMQEREVTLQEIYESHIGEVGSAG